MTPSRHIIISLSIGAVLWFFTKSVYAVIVCLASGVLADADHVIEYVIHYGWKSLTFEKIYEASEQTARQEGDLRFRRLYLVFHTGEIAILLWVATLYIKNIYLLAMALGYSSHLILDYMVNHLYLSSYFILWRAIKKFNTDNLFRK